MGKILNGINTAIEVVDKIRTLAVKPAATNTQTMTQYMTPTDPRSTSRTHLGRGLNMSRIETALKLAQCGNMAQITDISRETIDTDPHLASILFKRFGAMTTLPWEIIPAHGKGIDKDKAKYYEEVVREYLLGIPNLRQRLLQLGWALFDGRSAHEVVWKPVSTATGKYGQVTWAPEKLEWIHPRRLSFGRRRELVVTDETQTYGGNFSPIGISLHPDDLRATGNQAKFIAWTPSLFGEYQEREGLSPRALYWSFFKRFAQRERMILIELFGKPWRIIEVDESAEAGPEDLEAADNAADQLGGSSSARMPRGTKLRLEQLDAKSSQNHKDVVDDCDKQLSKLVLGQTGTTDPNPAGLNNTQADVMQDEQSVIQISDAFSLGEVVTETLVKDIIEVNFGLEEVRHAPIFRLRWDKPTSRLADLERLSAALISGIDVALSEAYESSGFRKPEDDETVLRIDQPPHPIGSANPPQPRAVIVHPPGTSPPVGEQNPSATVSSKGEGSKEDEAGFISTADLAKTVTVNEARAAQDLPPLELPGGGLDPDGDLTTVEFEAKKAANASSTNEFGFKAKPGADVIEVIGSPFELRGHYEALKALTNDDMATRIMASGEAGEMYLDEIFHLANDEDVADHKQPTTANGSPEQIVDKGFDELARETGKWAKSITGAIAGLSSAAAIFDQINRVADDLDTQPYARVLERKMRHSAAIAALDSSVDIGGANIPGFSNMQFRKAMQEFKKKNVVSKAAWTRLENEIKRKSFTVAGLQSNAMIQATQSELAKQIGLGADLKEFSKFLDDKFASAGLIKPARGIGSGAHIETVFRTNVLNAYGAGRHSHMSQPEVLRVRPIWTISTRNDPPRVRANHLRADKLNLYATDTFWQRAYPPFGFNCRCRVISRSLTSNLTITQGSTITYLPDPGFVSGIGGLLS